MPSFDLFDDGPFVDLLVRFGFFVGADFRFFVHRPDLVPVDVDPQFVGHVLVQRDQPVQVAGPPFQGHGQVIGIHLDRRMAEKRIYPAINVNRSGTRREELLLKPDVLQKMWILRKLLYNMDDLEAMEFLLDKIKATKNNAEFFDAMRRG